MNEYIKKEDAIKAIARYLSPVFERAEEGATRVLSDIPSADVVEVVRCKDCKWWDSDCGWCDLWGNTHEYKDGYCSYGERKTNDE